MIPGPCVICGGTNYELSCGGQTICPKCDCGNFDAATVMKQAKVIADLRIQLGKAKRAPDFLKSLQRTAKIMRSAHDKGGDRLMSIWLEDLQAVEEAVELLSHPDEEGNSK